VTGNRNCTRSRSDNFFLGGLYVCASSAELVAETVERTTHRRVAFSRTLERVLVAPAPIQIHCIFNRVEMFKNLGDALAQSVLVSFRRGIPVM
jgi:hypothetical protein